jgi:hypothetical protein
LERRNHGVSVGRRPPTGALIKLGIVEIDSANTIVRDSHTSFLLLQSNSEYASTSKSLYHRLIYLTIASHYEFDP